MANARLLAIAMAVLMVLLVWGRRSCNTRAGLRPMLMNIAREFDAANITWFF